VIFAEIPIMRMKRECTVRKTGNTIAYVVRMILPGIISITPIVKVAKMRIAGTICDGGNTMIKKVEIKKSEYYKMGPRPERDKIYVCPACGNRYIQKKETYCHNCKAEIIWLD
jgi:hypothetical protein